jgi:serpin B
MFILTPLSPQPEAARNRCREFHQTRQTGMTIIAGHTRTLAAAAALAGALTAGPAAAESADAQVRMLARAYNAAGLHLFGELSAKPGNVVISPYSIGTALSMALSGARGDTAAEMMQALSMRMTPGAVDAASARMLAILNGYDRSGEPPVCPPPASLSGGRCEAAPILDRYCPPGLELEGPRCTGPGTLPPSANILAANALMLHGNGDLISADYAGSLQRSYAAEIFRHAGLGDVNGWVEKKTAGKIPVILDSIGPDAAATLLNAVYFKARWAAVFSPRATQDDAFNLTRMQKADVAFMRQTDDFPLVTKDGYHAIRLNYAVRELSLVIVLPDDIEGADAVARRLDAGELEALFAALRVAGSREVALSLPRFKMDFKASLIPPLRQAGIHKAFDPGAADFSGMTGPPAANGGGVYIGQIVHRAVIEASEESTEAAAATAVEMMARAAAPVEKPPPVPFRADHPFLFYLTDDATGAILFEGRVADPRG